MTDEDLDKIDAECARHVMGGKVPIIFRPTRSWSDAGEVAEKVLEERERAEKGEQKGRVA